MQHTTLHLLSCLSSFLVYYCFPFFFLFFITLRSSGQMILYNVPPPHSPPNLAWSNVFIMMRLGLWAFGKNIIEVKCPSHHIIWAGTWYLHEITSDLTLKSFVYITMITQYFHGVCNNNTFHILIRHRRFQSHLPKFRNEDVFLSTHVIENKIICISLCVVS